MKSQSYINTLLAAICFTNYPHIDHIFGYSINSLCQLLESSPYGIRASLYQIIATGFFDKVTFSHPTLFMDINKSQQLEFTISSNPLQMKEDLYTLKQFLFSCTYQGFHMIEEDIHEVFVSFYSQKSMNYHIPLFFLSITPEEYQEFTHMIPLLPEHSLHKIYDHSDFEIVTKETYGNEDISSEFIHLWKAINRDIAFKNMISVKYLPRNTKESIRIDLMPLKLVYHYGNTTSYLLGIPAHTEIEENTVKNSLMSYRLDRILPESYRRLGSFSIPDAIDLTFLNQLWGMDMDLKNPPVKIKVQFFNHFHVFRKVYNDITPRMQKNPFALLYEEDNCLIYEDFIYGYNSFKSWIHKFGASVKVIEPQCLIDDIVASARKRSAFYI